MSTIAAIATARGAGGIGVIRLSGPDAKSLLKRIFRPHSKNFSGFKPWRLHHGLILDHTGSPLDDGLVVHMPAPNTFTGEEAGEIHCHGGNRIEESIIETLLALGARQAQRGEFSKRAFLNGRMDLSQAEAVAELIAAPSLEAIRFGLTRLEGGLSRQVANLQEMINELRGYAQALVDFPDDEVDIITPEAFLAKTESVEAALKDLLKNARRARLMHLGATIVLAGMVNAGKSSLLNTLAGRERALVSDMPGTTRDYIEETLDFDGLPVRLIDTAGLRGHGGQAEPVEKLGIDRAQDLAKSADLVILTVDGSINPDDDPVFEEFLQSVGDRRVLVAVNKTDLGLSPAWPPLWASQLPQCPVSARTGANLDELVSKARGLMLDATEEMKEESAVAPNARQARALETALDEMSALALDLKASLPYDCCLARIESASDALSGILHIEPSSELMDRIFSQFCIGK